MTTTLLARDISIALFAFGATAWFWLVWRNPELAPALASYRASLDTEFLALRRPALGRRVLSSQLTLCSVLIASAAESRSVALLGLAACAWLLPRAWLAKKRAQRLTRLESQLDTFLLALANALRATPSLGEALSSTSLMVAPPLRDEIEHVLKQSRLGVPLDHALHRAGAHLGSRTLSAAFLTLRIARASGGGVSACLESAAATLREMSRLDSVVRVKTAEGKGQATAIAVLPFPFVALLNWVDPAFLAPLASAPAGHAVIALCAGLWLSAVLLARRIVEVDL